MTSSSRILAGVAFVLVEGVFVACSGSNASDIGGGASGVDGGAATDAGVTGDGAIVPVAVCDASASCTRQDCSNGSCVCAAGSQCELSCASPPCHVDCLANSTCSGTCANGDCQCGAGASCEFQCASSPCHVSCAGKNPRCDGTCENGTCTCGEDSTCHFSCAGGPCHTECAAGAACIVSCTLGGAGTQDCDFSKCAAGTPKVCPDGKTITCGAECP